MLSGGTPPNFSCSNKSYIVQMRGNTDIKINMSKGFQQQGEKSSFQIEW
ncbi:MAG: hypothetical protein GXP45_08335 [bacterium]|nr:hypothetical protein [bacterium]